MFYEANPVDFLFIIKYVCAKLTIGKGAKRAFTLFNEEHIARCYIDVYDGIYNSTGAD